MAAGKNCGLAAVQVQSCRASLAGLILVSKAVQIAYGHGGVLGQQAVFADFIKLIFKISRVLGYQLLHFRKGQMGEILDALTAVIKAVICRQPLSLGLLTLGVGVLHAVALLLDFLKQRAHVGVGIHEVLVPVAHFVYITGRKALGKDRLRICIGNRAWHGHIAGGGVLLVIH